jgi:predicted SnoaL-like aldol condensation-catalyzing enzyme
MSDLERNKQNVVAFYHMMFNQCLPGEAVAQYVGAEYIQHSPHVATGEQGFIPRLVDQDPWAQLRRPMDMIRQG